MKTIHFVYTIHNRSFFKKLLFALDYFLRGADLYPRTNIDTSSYPDSSPNSISKNVTKRLIEEGYNVKLYHCLEKKPCHINDGDVLIGHPERPLDQTCFGLTLKHNKDKAYRKIILKPLHYDFPHYNAFINPIIPEVDEILAITGPYWFDTWESSCFKHWFPKMVHVDMAIDAEKFPLLKKRFSPKGKRKFLFIGNDKDYKGVDVLSILFQLAKGSECLWIGSGMDRPGILHHPPTPLTADFMSGIAENYDFFITMGLADCNPTTILESMAWGFPVCCTPTSGYHKIPSFFELKVNDMEHNLAVLDDLQTMDEEHLLQIQKTNRELVIKNYTWRVFTDKVLKAIVKN